MKKLTALALIVVVLLSITNATAETPYYQQTFDILHRSLKIVKMDASIPVKSPMEFISRYAYSTSQLGQDEPFVLMTSLDELWGNTLETVPPYAYNCMFGTYSIKYDKSMNWLYYETTMFDTLGEAFPTADELLNVVRFVQCIEIGYSSIASSLVAGYEQTLSSICTPLAQEALNIAASKTCDHVFFQTDNFAYVVNQLSVPKSSDKPAYEIFVLDAMPKQW